MSKNIICPDCKTRYTMGERHACLVPINTKASNPKDTVGVLKVSMSYVPAPVLWEIAIGMHEGGFKYGRHNYRVIGVRGSVYYDATMRHLMAWWEGEDIDPDSRLSHITKAITSLVVLRDAMLLDKFVDDRPPQAHVDIGSLNKAVVELAEKYPNPVPAYTQKKKADANTDLSEVDAAIVRAMP